MFTAVSLKLHHSLLPFFPNLGKQKGKAWMLFFWSHYLTNTKTQVHILYLFSQATLGPILGPTWSTLKASLYKKWNVFFQILLECMSECVCGVCVCDLWSWYLNQNWDGNASWKGLTTQASILMNFTNLNCRWFSLL